MDKFIAKSLILIVSASMCVFAAAAALAETSATDPVSGLPLMAGMTPSNDAMDISICGKPAQANQYMVRDHTVAADIAWYKQHLPGYHFVHAVWSDRSQDTFFSSDGTRAVNITGTPKSDKVFSLMFISLQKGLTEHQWMVFSPSNSSCK